MSLRTWDLLDGKLNVESWSFSYPDARMPHRHFTLASANVPEGVINLHTNRVGDVWWLAGTGNGFAGERSRIINTVCTRSKKTYDAWKAMIQSGNVQILDRCALTPRPTP